MKKFAGDLGISNIDQYSIYGALLNCDYSKKHVWENVIFVGDAAGLADPYSGEGIPYALQSGIDASDSIAAELCCQNKLEREYENRIFNIIQSLKKGEERQKLLFERDKNISSYLKYFKLFPELVKSYVDML